MPTPKKRTPAEPVRRKPGRRPAVSSPQAFDIIPRSQVKPSTNARPVITPNRPLQPDNTLVATSQSAVDGATPQLSHRPLKLMPTGEVGAEDAVIEQSTASQLGKVDTDAQDALQTEPVAPGADPEAIKQAISRRQAEEVPEAPVEDESDTSLDEAFAELGYAKADETPKAEPKVEETPAAPKPEDVPQDTPVEAPKAEDSVADEPKPEEVAVSADAEPEVASEPEKPKPTPGTVEHALHDETRQAIEHSQALKSELQNLIDKDDKKDKLPEDHPHHELYGGEPVIVIHKHKKSSAAGVVLMILICLIVAVAIADVLIDAEEITLNFNVPHADYL